MDTYEQSFGIAKTRRPWLRWLKRLGTVLLLALVAIAIRQAWHHHEVTKKLQEALAELDRAEPGWRLEDMEAARAEIPEEENSARVVVAAADLLPSGWPAHEFIDRFAHLDPQEQLATEDFLRLRAELARVQPALNAARKLADLPHGRHHLHYARNPLATLFPHVDKCRKVVSLLLYEALRQSQNGEADKTLISCRAALNTARSLGDEPIIISQMERRFGTTRACQAVERTLAQGEPPPSDLAMMQKLLEDEDAFPGQSVVSRGERALGHQLFEGMENGEISGNTLERWHGLGTVPRWIKSIYADLARMDTRQDHALYLSLMSHFFKDAQLPLHEQAAFEKDFERQVRELPTNAITPLLLPALSKLSAAFRLNHASLRCTMAALAAERYRQERKVWPESLEQLCPDYLAAVPLDPYDGAPLRYRRIKDGVIIYSFGPDVLDNGGNLDRQNLTKPGTDIGSRLWDGAKRRQPPRPKPPKP